MNFLACNNTGDGVSASSNLIKEGDCVIVYEGPESMKAVYVDVKGRFENRYGVFKHQSWIGKPFGSKVTANFGAGGWIMLLKPTPELWTQVLRHRTQILYVADISMIVMQLDIRPGSVVLESGTGSGSLTHSLVRAIAPSGHVHTFEFHEGRVADAAAEFKQHGLASMVTVTHRNIEELGFPESMHGRADAVFLDLPGPHKVVPSAASCLRPNGRFCAFSPCIEQVQKTAEALSASGFTDLMTYECLLREYEVFRETITTGLVLADPQPPAKRHRPGPPPPAAAAPATVSPVDAAAKDAGAGAAGEAAGEAGPQAAATEGDATMAPAEAGAAGETSGSAPGTEAAEQGAAEPSGGKGGEGEGDPAAAGAAVAAEAAEQGGSGAGQDGGEPQASSEPQQQEQQQQQEQEQQQRQTQQEQEQQRRRPAAPVRQAFVSFRPSLEARGHTGYLLFARKFVLG